MKLPCHAAKLLRHAARKRLLRFKAGILQGFRGLIEAAGLSPAGYLVVAEQFVSIRK